MTDWKQTNYGTPKSWDEIQRENREAQYDHEIKNGLGEPVAPLMWKLVIVGGITVAALARLVYLIFR